MKHKNNYKLCWLSDAPYLLPFGQASANLQRGVRINNTGVFLWNALRHETTKEELLEKMAAEYEPTKEELPLLQQDLEKFLNQLSAFEILSPDHTSHADSQSLDACRNRKTAASIIKKIFLIGGLTIIWQGPETLFSPEFEAFCINNSQNAYEHPSALSITIVEDTPVRLSVGQILIRTSELTIIKDEQGYSCIYPKQNGLVEWRLSSNTKNASLYCQKPLSQDTRQELFHAIRMIYLLAAQKNDLFALHSASILYQGKAFLFSGYSGAGKSTHTALWNKLYKTPLLNGDLNLIEESEHGPIVHGMPWCGTSHVSTTKTYALGGIIFLRQYPDDQILTMSNEQKELAVLQRMISPTWTEEMFLKNLSFAKKLSNEIPILKLKCTKNPSAASVCKEAIEQIYSEREK